MIDNTSQSASNDSSLESMAIVAKSSPFQCRRSIERAVNKRIEHVKTWMEAWIAGGTYPAMMLGVYDRGGSYAWFLENGFMKSIIPHLVLL